MYSPSILSAIRPFSHMNAGAYGGEMKDIIKTVSVITREGKEKTLMNSELSLGYRTSALQKSGDIVTEAVLALAEGDRESIEAAMRIINKGLIASVNDLIDANMIRKNTRR